MVITFKIKENMQQIQYKVYFDLNYIRSSYLGEVYIDHTSDE